MSTPNPFANIAHVGAVEGVHLGGGTVRTQTEMIGRLVAVLPLRVELKALNPSLPPRETTVSRVLLVNTAWSGEGDPNPVYDDMGEVNVMWTAIRAQLARSTPAVPWCSGTVVKAGRSYMLRPCTPVEAEWVSAALQWAQYDAEEAAAAADELGEVAPDPTPAGVAPAPPIHGPEALPPRRT